MRRLVAAHRLVTLTGVGGCGKTRLAIEVAYREAPSHPEGVWFVDLSTIADEAALPGVFASALRWPSSPGTDATGQSPTYLAPREALLVVDNCEHVIDAAADRIDALLEAAPGSGWSPPAASRSRSRANSPGRCRHCSPVPSRRRAALRGAGPGGRGHPARLIPGRWPRSVEVVERLDGIPLAIELAAARTRSCRSPRSSDLLDDRFSLLSGGARRVPPAAGHPRGHGPVVLRPVERGRAADAPDAVGFRRRIRGSRCRLRGSPRWPSTGPDDWSMPWRQSRSST